jgi:DNA-binding beta-propeller fold protein YncE
MMDDPLGERLYVTDTGNHHVDVYSTGGRFLFQFGARGSGAGQFLFPNDVVVDRAGIVYVADTGNHRVQVFDANGGYLRQFGGFGQGGDRLNGPSALALHPDGTLHVADKGNNRIQVFSLHGVYHGRYGGSGDALGQFRQLQAVAADSHGRVYAADRASWLVTMFGPQGQPFLRFQPRFADGTAAVPMGLAITDDDTLFVAAVRGPAGYRAVREFETALYIPTAAQAGRSSKE